MAHRLDPHRSLAGLAAAAVALGVAALLAIPFGPHADSRTAIGSVVIDLTPGPVKEWAIQRFGTSDKLFLTVAVITAIAVIAVVTAQFEDRKVGSVAIGLAGALGSAAVLTRAGAGPVDVVPALVGAAAGIVVLRLLISGRFSAPAPDPDGQAPDGQAPDPGRRQSLAALGFLAAGTLAGVLGTVLGRAASSVSGDRNAYAPPPPKVPAPPIPPGVQPAGVNLPTFITPNADFYRIDTALSVPQLERQNWHLRIHGMVDHEITYSFTDLAQFDAVDKVVTLTCVSNPVGGNLISNATWSGYRVRDLLARAGVHADADMVLSTSIDGFTAGTPVEALTDDRDALLAVAMNGEPLPTEHGYPARLVVPGLYGYVSATKWVVDLELTRFDRAQAYWTGLGWSAKGPIKTESRIDVPRSGAQVPRGAVTFGGVAWAQHRGVRAVEVRIDDGPWQPADLGTAYSKDTWRLWSFDWHADNPGRHTITVRATDDTGAVQTADVADAVPDGATGWHSVSFTVE
ncbi:molybdopterin-dependent oxidoreductase [Mycobacterium sp. CBMA293]|uniref:molybdopterin-dependent oxidoreductase n=1 Tax=unclassified Mycolicibacterium TaxID=2636767 RepID=UPI0013264A88|nr:MULTISPECIES: molybdopterin-dependent oxidoreductase [unclassified Mycolicibacterium]MUL45405.1 molybdopterin-dependent oxidoreductase [Mycolicibacterium sp. CBMA 360]MUL92014.1 molybdopterin-dependent oxidoreductase [Mycolicibacterium sp. CBMA 230]MUL56926.1 molybdopterin-dependent oxidoreductase [Mycolicibacterium sp. CBMA 335]MUL69966.1 molybdopterin-dependent oxidoreductase [Mycolicibacterium sp. CBMA 311]MUM05752.1 oxidoreductase [Mycolicibacterium sp. CBMA 213]